MLPLFFMKHKSILVGFFFILLLTGCSLYSKWHYGINPKNPPVSQEEYISRTGAAHFLSDSVFFRADKKLLNDFLLYRVFKDSQFVFMGVFLNDSCYIPSQAKEGNNACIGRIEKESAEILVDSTFGFSNTTTNTPLSRYGISKLSDDSSLSNAYFDKPVFVFLYSYRYGRYYKKLWENIHIKINSKGNKFKMMFISIDNNLPF